MTPFLTSGSPCKSGIILGTKNNEIPFVPSGAPLTLAKTKWHIFLFKS